MKSNYITNLILVLINLYIFIEIYKFLLILIKPILFKTKAFYFLILKIL